MICRCGKPFARHGGECMTLVGYGSPPGHDHDDNCLSRTYICEDGHATTLFLRRSCKRCHWKGKATCGCHQGEKITVWPENELPELNA